MESRVRVGNVGRCCSFILVGKERLLCDISKNFEGGKGGSFVYLWKNILAEGTTSERLESGMCMCFRNSREARVEAGRAVGDEVLEVMVANWWEAPKIIMWPLDSSILADVRGHRKEEGDDLTDLHECYMEKKL